ncbi:MAG: hypothetical protein Q9160_005919 [Pyrenula sp. 1 TL-2023]
MLDIPSKRPFEASAPRFPRPTYVPGTFRPAGNVYSRTLVLARTHEEDVGWISRDIPTSNHTLTVASYTVDDPLSELTVPVNKGHESMVYLTYIIDHYDMLNDVTMFMHSHQFAWHNNDLLNSDAANTVWRLNLEKVTREGYMNLRCHLQPGCVQRVLHPAKPSLDLHYAEEPMIAIAWIELFGPTVPVPETLAQPCCGQFAVSRDRLRALPREQYIHFRKWLIETSYADNISGRIFEHIWHFIFTGTTEACPNESLCYCDGFGLCFGGEREYRNYIERKAELKQIQEIVQNAEHDEAAHLKTDPSYRGGGMSAAKDKLKEKIRKMKFELNEKFSQALAKGDDAVQRAAEVERTKDL